MQNDFKVGDDVICICKDATGRKYFEENKRYKITAISIKNGTLKVQGSDQNWRFERFQKAKEPDSGFDYLKTPWFIRINTETEFNLVVGFFKSKGFVFRNFQVYERFVVGLTNCSVYGSVIRVGDLPLARLSNQELLLLEKEQVHEIKIQFETSIKSVIYPKIISEKDSEIQKIQEEMKKLSNRLETLKEEN